MAWKQTDIAVLWPIGNGHFAPLFRMEAVDAETLFTLSKGAPSGQSEYTYVQKRLAVLLENNTPFLARMQAETGAVPASVSTRISPDNGTGAVYVSFPSGVSTPQLRKIEADYRATKGNSKERETIAKMFWPASRSDEMPEYLIDIIQNGIHRSVEAETGFSAQYSQWEAMHKHAGEAITTLTSLGEPIPASLKERFDTPAPTKGTACFCSCHTKGKRK